MLKQNPDSTEEEGRGNPGLCRCRLSFDRDRWRIFRRSRVRHHKFAIHLAPVLRQKPTVSSIPNEGDFHHENSRFDSCGTGPRSRHYAARSGTRTQRETELEASSEIEVTDFGNQPSVASASELIPTLERSLAEAKSILNGFDDSTMMANWKLTRAGKELFSAPRVGIIRSIMLNHWYHHRGQLSVYLRLLDVPVPSIYGPSADENPFAA